MAEPDLGKTPTMQEVLKYWYTELSVEDIAAKLGITPSRLRRLRHKYGLPTKGKLERSGVNEYEPRPEEIAAAARKIREGWTATQEAARRVVPAPASWTPPAYLYDSKSGIFSRS